MIRFIRTFRYVHYISKRIKKYEKEHGSELLDKSTDKSKAIFVGSLEAGDVLEAYARKHHTTPHKVLPLSIDACAAGYLQSDKTADGKEIIRIAPKGRKLLDFPLGTIQTFSDEYGSAATFVGAFIIASPAYYRLLVKITLGLWKAI